MKLAQIPAKERRELVGQVLNGLIAAKQPVDTPTARAEVVSLAYAIVEEVANCDGQYPQN